MGLGVLVPSSDGSYLGFWLCVGAISYFRVLNSGMCPGNPFDGRRAEQNISACLNLSAAKNFTVFLTVRVRLIARVCTEAPIVSTKPPVVSAATKTDDFLVARVFLSARESRSCPHTTSVLSF